MILLLSEISVVGVDTLLGLISFLGLCIIGLAKVGYTHHLNVVKNRERCDERHLEASKKLAGVTERMRHVEGKLEGHCEARQDFRNEVKEFAVALLDKLKDKKT